MKSKLFHWTGYILCVGFGLLIGALISHTLWQRDSKRTVTTFLSSQIMQNIEIREAIRIGSLKDAERDLEQAIGMDFLGIMEVTDWKLNPKLLEEYKGLTSAARYWRKYQFKLEPQGLDEMFRDSVKKIPE